MDTVETASTAGGTETSAVRHGSETGVLMRDHHHRTVLVTEMMLITEGTGFQGGDRVVRVQAQAQIPIRIYLRIGAMRPVAGGMTGREMSGGGIMAKMSGGSAGLGVAVGRLFMRGGPIGTCTDGRAGNDIQMCMLWLRWDRWL